MGAQTNQQRLGGIERKPVCGNPNVKILSKSITEFSKEKLPSRRVMSKKLKAGG